MWRGTRPLLGLGLLAGVLGSSPTFQGYEETASTRIKTRALGSSFQGLGNSEHRRPQQLSGYFQLNRTYDAHMFFFYFQARNHSSEAPLVLWMTGGPGCSSELAVFYENGPFSITKDLKLKENPYGWDKYHNMIFVDQPVNTGFSYSEDPRDRVYDEKVVAADMLDFFGEFLKAFPQYEEQDLFITGESYAGHYVPAVAHKVWSATAAGIGPNLNLRGLAIGNGLTDPVVQYGAYADFAVSKNIIPRDLGDALNAGYPVCAFGIRACNYLGWSFVCQLALTYCQSSVVGPIQAVGDNFNVYDVRLPCIGPLCYDFSRLDDYIALPSVREDLGVGDRPWVECDPDVNADMMGDILRSFGNGVLNPLLEDGVRLLIYAGQGDWMKNYEDLVGDLLSDGKRALVYAGVEDFICNWLGNYRWVSKLPWADSDAFRAAPFQEWHMPNGSVAGTVKTGGGLSFVKVKDAGHMVPMDEPASALRMITRFTRDESLAEPAPEAGEARPQQFQLTVA